MRDAALMEESEGETPLLARARSTGFRFRFGVGGRFEGLTLKGGFVIANQRRLRGWLGFSAAMMVILALVGGLVGLVLAPPTVVLVVRHAEKAAAPASDPPLSAAGQTRTQELIHVAGQAGVQAIYASQFLRTQQTVQPLATQLGLSVTQWDAADVDGLVADIWANHSGQVVLVVGHSDTVPQIIQKLRGGHIPPIGDNEFDNLYVVLVPRLGWTRVLHMKYGDPS